MDPRANPVQAEDALRRLLDGLRDLAGYSLDAFGRVAAWSGGAATVFGFGESEILGRPNSLFYAPWDIENGVPEKDLATAVEQGSLEESAWRIRKDGSRFYAQITVLPLRDSGNRVAGYAVAVRDVSKQRATEEALLASEERHRLLIQQVQDYAIYLLDPAGLVLSWNRGAERIKGWKGDEVIGKSFSMFYTHDQILRGLPRWELNMASAEGRVDVSGWRVRKDGTRFWADVVLTALRDESGQLIGYSKIVRDVTGRKYEEDRFRTAVESAPNAMVMVNRDGRIVLVNAQTEKLFGYNREELLGRSVEVLVPERFRGTHPGHRGKFMREPQTRAMGAGRDLFGLRKDGTEFPVEIGLNPIQTEEGAYVLAAIVDITERKRAEEKFRIAVESAPNAMVMVNHEGRIVLVNAQTERLLGYSRDELLNEPIEKLVPERFRPAHPGFREGFLREPQTRPMGKGRDLFARRKDGTDMPVEIGLNPLRTEEGTFVLASIVDLRERKRQEADQKFLVEVTTAMNASLDYETTLANVARLVLPRLGDSCMVDLVGADGRVHRVASFPENRQDPETLGTAAAVRTGTARTSASEMILPVRLGERALGAFRFESRRGYGPSEFALAEEVVRRAAIAIDNANHFREAREAVRARDEFLSIASHELKTPITTLQLEIDTIRRAIAKGRTELLTPETLKEVADALKRQGERLTHLVDTLLDISRITADRLKLSLSEVDLAEAARAIVERHKELIERTGSSVIVKADGPAVGRWDRLRLDQVLTNLLTNALKYGKGRPVAIHVEKTDAGARLTVQDQGIGIKPEDRRRIFRPFERISPDHATGLGMGLYIVQKIVHAHGGTIGVRSAPGQGTEFVVELPLAPSDSE